MSVLKFWDPTTGSWAPVLVAQSPDASGTSFPANPGVGQRYFRTDIRNGMGFVWDGTRWLSEQQFQISADIPGVTADYQPVWTAIPTDYPIWLEAWESMIYLAPAATWVLNVDKILWDESAYANIVNRSSAGLTAARWYSYRDAIGVVCDGTLGNSSSNQTGIRIWVDEQTGTSGYYAGVRVYYRLIAT